MAAGVYATVGLLVATATASDDFGVSPLLALLGTGLFALIVFGGGASREAGLWPSLVDRVSPVLRLRIRAASVGLAFVVFCAALLLAISLALHFSDGLTVLDALSPGLIGNILLLVLGIAYLPNALIWVSAFLFGTGFAIGEGTAVSPFAVEAGPLPAFPLLTAVPSSVGSWLPIVLLLPLVAGALATRVGRKQTPLAVRRLTALVERLWIAGLAAAVVLVAASIAGGALGTGQMSDLGPNALLTAFAAFALLLIGGILGDSLRALMLSIRARRADTDSLDLRDESKDFLGVSKSLG